MQMNIQTTTENHLLQRKEIVAAVEFDGATPSNTEVILALASKLGVDAATIELHTIATKYGHRQGIVRARVYSSPELKQKMMLMTKHLKKKAEAESKKAAEAKKEGGP